MLLSEAEYETSPVLRDEFHTTLKNKSFMYETVKND